MAKFCTGCGAPIEDAAKFCVSCGTPNTQPEPQPQPQAAPPQYQQPQQYQQPYPAYPPPQPYAAPPAAAKPKKKHKGLKILLGFVGAIVLLIVSIPILLGAGGNMDYYNIGNEKVASVKLALGEKRKLSGTSSRVENGANIKAFTYGEPDRDQAADMSAYLKYLRANEGFLVLTDVDFSTPEAWCKMGRNSEDKGYRVIVQIEYDAKGYVITLVKEEGEITPARGGPDEPDDDPYSTDNDAPTTQPSNVQPPATQAPKPPGPGGNGSLSKSVLDTLSGGTYHIKMRSESQDVSADTELYVKGSATAMLVTAEGMDIRMVYKDGKAYSIIPEMEMMMVTDIVDGNAAPTMGDTEDLTYVGEGSGEFGGGTYRYDEYRDRDGARLFYFVDGGMWKGVRTITDGETSDMIVRSFDRNVPDSVFEIPSNYQIVQG